MARSYVAASSERGLRLRRAPDDQRLVRWLPVLGLFGVLMLAGWAWGSVRHDHDGEHGAPLTVAELRAELTATGFATEHGSSSVRRADCVGEGERARGGFTHFRCDLRFANGKGDRVVVHVRPTELTFRSDAA
jgi:hypothetical protein